MEEKKKQNYFDFILRIREFVPFYGFSSIAIELVFLKYMSEYTEVDSPEEFKTIMNFKNMFINKKFVISLVNDVFRLVERKYNINFATLSATLDDLFKLFNNSNRAEGIFTILNHLEMPKTNEEMVDFIEDILSFGESKDVTRTEVFTTNTSLVKLVQQILDVKDNEIFMNAFAGFSKSFLRIKAKRYIGYEINSSVAAIANMIMILSKKKDFSIINQDYYLADIHSLADKVFSDGPFGHVLSTIEYSQLGEENKKGDYYSVKKAVESLKPNGRAIVTCVGGILFRTDLKKLREQFTAKNLTAVIALPPLWNGYSLPTNLLVFDNERKENSIIMVDASTNDCINKLNKRTIELTDEAIKKIVNSLKGEIIDGFSTKVAIEKIFDDNQELSWVPTRYITTKTSVNFRTSKDVKIELDKAYDDLYKLLKK